MDVWNTLKGQIATLWRQWSVQQRVGISTAAVVCLAAVIGSLIWATQPEYILLHAAESTREADAITTKLDTEQIPWKPNFSGRIVYVSRGDAGKARMAVADIVDPLSVGEAGSASMFPETVDGETERRRAALEAHVARTIERIKGISTATVHITRPDPSPFVMEQTETKASIMLAPAARGSITSDVAQRVIFLVAGAVEGLSPENVFLTDTNANRYSVSDGISGDMTGRMKYQSRLETQLVHNAESMLDSMLGEGKSEVRVYLDIDFRDVSRTEKIIDPSVKAKISETQSIGFFAK